ncbi:MAG: LD-carboxypeptidase [Firmicutes bacterium]|jgi:muramoyltetrapeptide carboxypeptidase|nr:LD-carboxypeptidase [Bacillota bacterium]HOB23027.1 LD-carboxypeptidase [Bacillota bacterium]HQD39971.1 LD-carboxypeptidase [Bacillota bacterium]
MLKPPALGKGDLICVIAPASPPEEAALDIGCRYLKMRGFKVRKTPSNFDMFRSYLAAPDERRKRDLLDALCDPNVDAVFCARGGYGCLRLLDLEPPPVPKIFLGYSDITTLHLVLNRKMVTFHGPMVASNFAEIDPFTEENLWQMLTAPKLCPLPHPDELPPPRTIYPGRCEGILCGGNLSLVAASLGTQYEIDTCGKILLLEEVDEPTYKVDRMLRHLYLAGKLQKAAGIVFGYSPTIFPQEEFFQLLGELAALKIPILYGLAFGHGTPKLTIPLGVLAQLNASEGQLSLLEAPVI